MEEEELQYEEIEALQRLVLHGLHSLVHRSSALGPTQCQPWPKHATQCGDYDSQQAAAHGPRGCCQVPEGDLIGVFVVRPRTQGQTAVAKPREHGSLSRHGLERVGPVLQLFLADCEGADLDAGERGVFVSLNHLFVF